MSLKTIIKGEFSGKNKDEIQDMIDSSLSDFKKEIETIITKRLKSREFQEDIKTIAGNIADKAIKGRDNENKIHDVAADMFVKYNKVLWQRNKQWVGAIKK